MGQPCPVKLDDVNLSSGVVETILASRSYLLDWDDVTWCFFSALKNRKKFKTSLGRPWKIHVRKKRKQTVGPLDYWSVNHLAELSKDHPVQGSHHSLWANLPVPVPEVCLCIPLGHCTVSWSGRIRGYFCWWCWVECETRGELEVIPTPVKTNGTPKWRWRVQMSFLFISGFLFSGSMLVFGWSTLPATNCWCLGENIIVMIAASTDYLPFHISFVIDVYVTMVVFCTNRVECNFS